MIAKIKQFFLDLINNNNASSSKRFVGLTIVFTAICLAITATVKNNGNCPIEMFNSLLILAGGCFGFNMAENIFKKTPITTDETLVDSETKVDNPDS